MRYRDCAAMLAASALMACGTDHIGPGHYGTIYTTGLVAYATPKGEMATEIRGNVPGTPEAVTFLMRPPGWLPPFRFTTRPGPETPAGYRVILHFDPASAAVSGERVCQGERSTDLVPPPKDRKMRIQAVFCAYDRLASEANGYTDRPASLDDPAFRNTLDLLLATLLPPRNPVTERFDAGCRFRPC